ncbi:MAG: hypothetical protein JST12_10450 [Armatimonadetes bacterium]|nr:hypothetical protein [Armatimonadota bacterium]MBS1728090.1 hypothetical protein [Armatimonadota bacterium]
MAEGKKPFNKLVIIGMWMTLGVILFWAGGEAFKKVEAIMPWILALSVLILVLGLLMQYRKPKDAKPTSEQK